MVNKKNSSTVTVESCERDKRRLPSVIKSKFGQLGFVKWTCGYCPVLIVDPIELVLTKALPTGIYYAWIYQIERLGFNLRKQEEDERDDLAKISGDEVPTEQLPVLIYWLGTSYEFSVVQLKDVMSWETARRRGYDELPEIMARRISALGRPVPAVYSLVYDALGPLTQTLLSLEPQERTRRILTKRKRNMAVLNEWHALAIQTPPQVYTWQEQKRALEPSLPNRDMFGQIAFLPRKLAGASQTYHHPVLILSPFRAHPGKMRTEWFNKCSSGIMVMVYWLGSYTAGRQQSTFTFHFLNELISYREGQRKNYDEVPQDIVNEYGRTDLKPRRLAAIDWWVCAHWELKQALKRKPEDRWGGLEDFEEDHDDDFDYYWQCISASRDALVARASENTDNRKKESNQAQKSTFDDSLSDESSSTSTRKHRHDSHIDEGVSESYRKQRSKRRKLEAGANPNTGSKSKLFSGSAKTRESLPLRQVSTDSKERERLISIPRISSGDSSAVPLAVQSTSSCSSTIGQQLSDEDLDYRIQDNTLGHATISQHEPKVGKKRKSPGSISTKKDSDLLEKSHTERLSEWKRQQLQVVNDVILQWMDRKNKNKHN